MDGIRRVLKVDLIKLEELSEEEMSRVVGGSGIFFGRCSSTT
jgi:natural product precursor